jgi:hypothetical protein
MRRYTLASLITGLVYIALGLSFVHFVLPADVEREFTAVMDRIAADRGLQDDGGGTAMHVAIVIAMRLLFGFITMAMFGWFQRHRPRFRAARLAGVGMLVLELALLVLFSIEGLPLHAVFVALGYCLVETQVAAHAGMLAWGRPAPKS